MPEISSFRTANPYRPCLLAGAIAASLLVGTLHAQSPTTPAPVVAAQVRFDIPAQPAAEALNAFARQSGWRILFPYDAVEGKRVRAIEGAMSSEAALQRLLEDTGLAVASRDDGVITLCVGEAGRCAPPRPQRVSDGSVDGPLGARDAGSQAASAARTRQATDLETVIVTGTFIRGATSASLASPIRVVGREEIDRSGYATTGDVIRSLPQAFSGNQNPGAFPIAGMAPANNFSAASSADLRGLGPGATLTLLNGRRLAYNGYANTVDIGMIPLPALDRVEVVTDGASALYGSDAVAGVVNFILRDDFEGAETTLRFGASSRGGAAERQVSQLFGTGWNGGNLLFNVERYEQEALYADQREVSRDLLDPSTLLPEQARTSALFVLNQDIGRDASLFLEALYADKDVASQATYSYSPPTIYRVRQTTDTRQYGLNAGVRFPLGADWRGEAAVNISRNREEFLELHNVFDPYAVFFANRLRGLEVNAQGPLFRLPAGMATSAVGAGYREELLDGQFVNVAQHGERTVKYAFGELGLPLYEAERRRLSASLSGRYESYDDFGSVFNPRVGLVYQHAASFKLRATWGESFRAPSLYQVHGARQATLYNAATFRVPGVAPDAQAIYLSGANPDLGPERSRSWTVGADFTPEAVPGLRVSVTYYDIDYRDRIVSGGTTVGIWDNPQFQHMVVKYPSATFLQDLLRAPTQFHNGLGVAFDPAKVVGVFKVNQRNATRQDIRGIDLGGSYDWDLEDGYLSAYADISWLDIRQVDTQGAQWRDLSGYLYFPAKRKARTGLSWSRGGWSATGTLNHISGSLDNTGIFISGAVNRDAPVASWTTLDAQVSYDTGEGPRLVDGVRISLSARNLLDRAPPAVSGSSGGPLSRGLGFDPQNASALQRFLSLSLSKRW